MESMGFYVQIHSGDGDWPGLSPKHATLQSAFRHFTNLLLSGAYARQRIGKVTKNGIEEMSHEEINRIRQEEGW